MPDPSPSSMPQPPFDAHGHDTHCKNANALHREALLQALGSIISPKRPTLMSGRSTSSIDSSRSTSGTASPAHGHPAFPHLGSHTHTHPQSPLAEHAHVADSARRVAPQDIPLPVSPAPSTSSSPAYQALNPRANAKIIDSLKSKNSAWDALIHGSFS